MNKMLASALFSLALLGLVRDAWAADTFWVSLVDGQTWSFLQTGRVINSDGSNSSWGPERIDVQISAVDLQLLGRHVDWRAGGASSNYAGSYVAETAAGLFRVSEGNPETDTVYRYYTDPQPWLYLTMALDVGQPLLFSGHRRGVWGVPGGTEAWSGTWTQTLTNLGNESVTTPLGTFNALKLQVDSVTTVDTRALFPNATSRATWDELRWFVTGLGYVKVQGSGLDETDFDGDGVVDRWQFEQQSMVAVPEPAVAWYLLAGLALLAALRCRAWAPAGRF